VFYYLVQLLSPFGGDQADKFSNETYLEIFILTTLIDQSGLGKQYKTGSWVFFPGANYIYNKD